MGTQLERAALEQGARELLALLHQHEGLAHLDVEVRGDAVILFSTEDGEKVRRARFTTLGAGHYGLSLTRHTGRWEPTPFHGPLPEVVEVLVAQLGFHLAPFP
jgi:hypothetical protein